MTHFLSDTRTLAQPIDRDPKIRGLNLPCRTHGERLLRFTIAPRNFRFRSRALRIFPAPRGAHTSRRSQTSIAKPTTEKKILVRSVSSSVRERERTGSIGSVSCALSIRNINYNYYYPASDGHRGQETRHQARFEHQTEQCHRNDTHRKGQ